MKRVYFAHPLNTYNSRIEKISIGAIASCFQALVENPNTEEHKEGYEKARSRCGNGMVYFFDILIECDFLVALPFPDLMFGSGVAWEMRVMFALKRPVYEIGYGMTIMRLHNLALNRVLSVTETIERIHNPVVRIRIQ